MHGVSMYVEIEGKFAKHLGYENLVGATGIIEEVMDALCSITIMTCQDLALIGKTIDIHKEDCILQTAEVDQKTYDIVVDYENQRAYYGEDSKYMKFIAQTIGMNSTRVFPAVSDLSEVIGFYQSWDLTIHPAEDDYDQRSKPYRDAYRKKHAHEEYMNRMSKYRQIKSERVSRFLAQAHALLKEGRVGAIDWKVLDSIIEEEKATQSQEE